jgi:hypothetical protein
VSAYRREGVKRRIGVGAWGVVVPSLQSCSFSFSSETPIRPYADTPIRRYVFPYAPTFPLPLPDPFR